MGGWVIDIYVAFLVRALLLGVRRLRSRSWPTVTGSVTESAYQRNVYGCDVAEIYYTYDMSGEPYTGKYRKPFIFRSNGEAYVRRFSHGTILTVRVKPGEPSVSVALPETWQTADSKHPSNRNHPPPHVS